MAISAKKWTPKHHENAKSTHSVLFKWEMDKRYASDEKERISIQSCGVISIEKARRIWSILQERP